MIFFRRWLLVSLLLLSGGNLFAATREDRAFAAAAAAFQDGIYDRAENGFAQFIRNFPKSTNVPPAVLSLAQAQFKQGKFAAATKTLSAGAGNAGALADQFSYWLGEAQFAKGDLTNAAATLAALPQKFPESTLGLTAVVEAAAVYARLGDWPLHDALLEATNGIFARTAKIDPDNVLVVKGRLSLAQSKLTRGDFTAAEKFLDAVNPKLLAPEQEWQRLNLSYQAATGLADFDAALAAANGLAQLAKDSVRQAEAAALRATALEKKNLFSEAAAAWSANLSSAAPPERQREAILKIAALALARNDTAGAATNLETYLKQYPNSPAAELALVTLGELRMKEFAAAASPELLAEAQTNFDRFIGAFPDSSLKGKAFLDRGWCNWNAQRYAESLVDFREAAKRLPASPEQAVAKFKTGDAMFVLTNYAGARQNYAAVLDGYEKFPEVAGALGDRALYQILRADIELADTNGAAAAMAKMLEKFPASDLADNSQLLLGEAFSDFRQPQKAREVLLPFAKLFPRSPLLPQVELALARTFEREGDWPAAVTNYAAWVQNHPADTNAPQAQFSLARAHDHAGQEAEAFRLFTDLSAKYPTNALAPLAQWWLADYFFRAGNFVAAETNYEIIFQTPVWKNSAGVYFQAQLAAGRAAAARQGYADAANYLTKMLADTNCPAPVATEAMFAYGGVLMRMDSPDTNRPTANFELATNVFRQIQLANATNVFGVMAENEFADCCLQLGALDMATNSYAQAAGFPAADGSLRSRAKVGLGIALEKKAELADGAARLALLKQARDNYQDVLDAFRAGELTDAFWAKKAGLQELAVLPKTGVKDLDRFYADLETLLPSLKETLEKKKSALKN
jgi:TolA-binding protein